MLPSKRPRFSLLSFAFIVISVPAFGRSTATLAPAPLVLTGKAAEMIVTHIRWKPQERHVGEKQNASFFDFVKTHYTIPRSYTAWIGIYDDLTCFRIQNYKLRTAELLKTDYTCFIGPETQGSEGKFRFLPDGNTVEIRPHDTLDTLWGRLNNTEGDYDKARLAKFDWVTVKGDTVERTDSRLRQPVITIHLDR